EAAPRTEPNCEEKKTTPALRRASVRRSSRSLVLRLRGLARLSRLVALLVTRLAVLSRGKLADFLRRVRHVLLHVLDRLVDDRVERRVQRVAHLVVVFADDFADSLVVDILTTAEVEKLLVADLVLSAEELVGRVALRDDGRLALLT